MMHLAPVGKFPLEFYDATGKTRQPIAKKFQFFMLGFLFIKVCLYVNIPTLSRSVH